MLETEQDNQARRAKASNGGHRGGAGAPPPQPAAREDPGGLAVPDAAVAEHRRGPCTRCARDFDDDSATYHEIGVTWRGRETRVSRGTTDATTSRASEGRMRGDEAKPTRVK